MKTVIVSLFTSLAVYGGAEAAQELIPVADKQVAVSNMSTVLRYADALEIVGYEYEDALQTAFDETGGAEEYLTIEGDHLRWEGITGCWTGTRARVGSYVISEC